MNAIINFFKSDSYNAKAGVHPPEHKAESTQLPIATLPLLGKLVIPLRQHIGNIPKILVNVGEPVLKGQLLAEAEGAVSAAIHAPTSGMITAIEDAIIPHPSGLPDLCITLTPDGKDAWITRTPQDWQNVDKCTLVASLRSSGIVGLGGATFPTHIKLRADGKSNVHTLIINAAECEPYITCDDMLMREHADEVVKGIVITQHLLGASKSIIGIEDNKLQAIAAMQAAIQSSSAAKTISISIVPTLYPSGDSRQLIRLVSNVEIPHDKRTTEMGLQVFNVGTVRAIYRYFVLGEPAISRIVTVTGNVSAPRNFEVLFGTLLPDLIQAVGGAKPGTTHYIMGGPMMGFDLPDEQVPVTKAANCIIAAAPDLFPAPPPAMPCIRCARCAEACPVNLQPQELYWFAKSDNFEKARDYNLFDCIECGCCTYVCPSDIPLVQYYRYAKSEIIAIDKAKEAADLARERNDFRLARIEREKLERAQKHAERAQAAKADSKADDAKPNEMLPEKQKVAANVEANTPAATDKQAAIAAAIARAKAQKLAAAGQSAASPAEKAAVTETAETLKTESAEPSAAETQAKQAKQDKQALIAAAIERAKAQKLAAAQAGVKPRNTENVSAAIQAEINETDAIREKAKLTLETKDADSM